MLRQLWAADLPQQPRWRLVPQGHDLDGLLARIQCSQKGDTCGGVVTISVGSAHRAAEIAEYHHGGRDCEPDGCGQIGTGSHRTIYLDHDAAIVYKIGDGGEGAATLTSLRSQGRRHAPEATLYTVTVLDQFGEEVACTVVAMPYLPDDGSVTRPYPILEGAADLNPVGNVHANGGQLWLIDAGGL